MTTGTVTWVSFRNYGTQLQAYALQQYLKQAGVENWIVSDREIVEEIDRRNEQRMASVQKDAPSVSSVNRPDLEIPSSQDSRSVLKKVLDRIHKKKKRIQKEKIKKLMQDCTKRYDQFQNEKLHLVEGLQRKDMPSLDSRFDAYICGSDQIWSLLERNFDPYFFLDFTKKRKISYAASVGATEIGEEQAAKMAPLLLDFHAVSVRERQTAEQLTRWLPKSVSWVVDPTLLLDQEFWKKETQAISVKKRNHLLCYFLENKPWYFDYAQQLAGHLGLELVLLPSRTEYASHRWVYPHGVGPLEFVKLVDKADFVLTDSYHGMLFSLNLNKQFLYLKRFDDRDSECQNIRIYSLVEHLHLEQCIVEEKQFAPSDVVFVPYGEISASIAALRAQSQSFLLRSLQDEQPSLP